MADPDAARAPRLSREMRGRLLFLVGATVFAAAVGLAVSRLGGSSSPSTTLIVSTAASRSGHGVTTTTSSQSASVGYDGSAICSPTTDAATSGGSPQELTSSASEVASGTIEGKAWSLWSAHGQSGAAGLEDGGLVFDGREYGLCAGYPNPSESEMIDTGGDAIIYGVVGYPGLAKVQVGHGPLGSLAMGTVLPSPHVSVVDGVSFYIGTLPHSSCSYSYFEINTTSPSYSTEHNIGFGGNGVGQGYSITNNPGNAGACVTGKLDPLSYSEGVWQLPPGQFQGNAASGSISNRSAGTGSGASSVSVPNDTSTCSPTTDPSSSGGSPSAITSTGTEVASGTVQGQAWSLWSAQGQSGAEGIENGDLVLGGRAYGLCPGLSQPGGTAAHRRRPERARRRGGRVPGPGQGRSEREQCRDLRRRAGPSVALRPDRRRCLVLHRDVAPVGVHLQLARAQHDLAWRLGRAQPRLRDLRGQRTGADHRESGHLAAVAGIVPKQLLSVHRSA